MAKKEESKNINLLSIADSQGVDLERIFAQLDINKEDLEESIAPEKSLKILVTGKSGVGKSTLINDILDMEIADETESEAAEQRAGVEQIGDEARRQPKERARVGHRCDVSETPGVQSYEMTKLKEVGITVTVWDSRGLLDGSDEKEQKASLKKMVSMCSDADLKLFCVCMNVPRFFNSRDNPDVLAMIKIVEAFAAIGKKFWENTVVVFTFANAVLKRDFYWKFAEREQVMRNIISTYGGLSDSEARKICMVPAGDHEEVHLPGRKYWLSSLWIECLHALPNQAAQKAMIEVNQHRFITQADAKEKVPRKWDIVLGASEDKFSITLFKILSCAAGGAATGGAFGTTTLIAGPIGAAIGIPAGGILGFCVGLAIGVHKVQEEQEKRKVCSSETKTKK